MKYLLIAIIFFSFSCTKDRSYKNCLDKNIYRNATIVFSGPVATDGCDWLVKIDDTHSYHPDVLSNTFKQDQLTVRIAYELTPDKFICWIGALQIPVIHVIDIKFWFPESLLNCIVPNEAGAQFSLHNQWTNDSKTSLW